MANTIRIKRRAAGGAPGAPSSLENAELAFNEQDDVLYYGKGTGGENNSATQVIAIGGPGAFQAKSTSLSNIASLTGTGFLRYLDNNSWQLDQNTYLTSISSSDVTTALGFTPENSANKGVANGYASLDATGKVPSSQLPAFVDEVLEYPSLNDFPAQGIQGVLYVTLDTNKVYRWSGTTYVEINSAPGTTDSVVEGVNNLYFTTARARGAVSASGSISYNQSTGVFSFSDAVTSVAGKTGDVTLSASDVGLGNVENTKLSTWTGSSNLVTLGTVTGGTWTASTISLQYGGTGSNLSATSDNTIFKKSGTQLVAAQVGVDYLSNSSTVDGGTF